MSDFFRNLVKDMQDEDTSIMGDGLGAAEYSGRGIRRLFADSMSAPVVCQLA